MGELRDTDGIIKDEKVWYRSEEFLKNKMFNLDDMITDEYTKKMNTDVKKAFSGKL